MINTQHKITLFFFKFKESYKKFIKVRTACTILFILSLSIFSVAQSGGFTQNRVQNPGDVCLNGTTNQFLFDESKDLSSIAFEAETNVEASSNSMCAPVDLNIFFDYFPEQTSWDITDANGNVAASSNGTYVNLSAARQAFIPRKYCTD